jgi:hypothetical protein
MASRAAPTAHRDADHAPVARGPRPPIAQAGPRARHWPSTPQQLPHASTTRGAAEAPLLSPSVALATPLRPEQGPRSRPQPPLTAAAEHARPRRQACSRGPALVAARSAAPLRPGGMGTLRTRRALLRRSRHLQQPGAPAAAIRTAAAPLRTRRSTNRAAGARATTVRHQRRRASIGAWQPRSPLRRDPGPTAGRAARRVAKLAVAHRRVPCCPSRAAACWPGLPCPGYRCPRGHRPLNPSLVPGALVAAVCGCKGSGAQASGVLPVTRRSGYSLFPGRKELGERSLARVDSAHARRLTAATTVGATTVATTTTASAGVCTAGSRRSRSASRPSSDPLTLCVPVYTPS